MRIMDALHRPQSVLSSMTMGRSIFVRFRCQIRWIHTPVVYIERRQWWKLCSIHRLCSAKRQRREEPDLNISKLVQKHFYKWMLTRSLVKCPTTQGVMKPVVVPKKLIRPYNVPAKLGAKSCEFCKLVTVEAPLNPSDTVIIATHQYGW